MASNYTKTVWTNNALQPINKTNLDKIEEGLFKASDGANIKQWYEAEADTNVFTDAEKAHIASPPSVKFDPQTEPPIYIEGQQYYDAVKRTQVIHGAFSDVSVKPGHTLHTHVINNSGVAILKGHAVRHDGVSVGGVPQIAKALADTFVNARLFGIAEHNIAIGAEGSISTFGEIDELDTSLLPTGVPLYLSDTIAGTYTATAPSIATRIGGALTSDAIDGVLFVDIINNTNIPTVFGGLQGHTVGNEVYTVDVTVQDMNDFLTETEVVVLTDALTGQITLPNDGAYRANFTADISFPSTITTRAVKFEVYDVTNSEVLFTYTKNIPRDATDDGVNFSYPFPALVDNVYKMRVRSNVAISITFNDVSFDIESVSIR